MEPGLPTDTLVWLAHLGIVARLKWAIKIQLGHRKVWISVHDVLEEQPNRLLIKNQVARELDMEEFCHEADPQT